MHDAANLQVGSAIGQGDDAFAVGVEVAQKALSSIQAPNLSALLVFASVRYNLDKLLKGIHRVVRDVPVFGATTAGEILNEPQHSSVVVLALASPYLKVRLGVGKGVSRNWLGAVAQAISGPEMAPLFSPQGSPFWQELTLQGKSAFGILFSPGNTRGADSRSFEILEELKRLSMGRLPIIGGSAADDWRLETNYVFAGQRAYPDSLVVAVFETQLRFGIALAHGFYPTKRKATVTRAINHEVLELDGQPAAVIYCRLQDTSREALEGKHLTLTTRRPMGIPDAYGQYSLNVASYFTAAGGIRFSQPVPEGNVLTVMEADPDNLIAAAPEALRKALLRGSVAHPAAVLVFSCALRARLLGEEIRQGLSAMKGMLPEVPLVGFYSFGEQGVADDGVSRHNNEVLAALVLGRDLSFAAQVALENERLRQELVERDSLVAMNEALHAEIAERRRAEQELRVREQAISTSINGIAFADPQQRVTYCNRSFLQMWGFNAPDDVIGRSIPELIADQQQFQQVFSAFLKDGFFIGELKGKKQDGTMFDVQLSATTVKNEKGEPTCLMASFVDIAERKNLEDRLRQAQKMEAVGRLAGGVAHDFNNILTAIIGYSELLLASLADHDPLRPEVQEIQRAADRAASLTRQLLAFSRKQVLQPRLLHLNALVADMDKMLRRIIGEEMELVTILGQKLGLVKADPGQMEQIIMNLAVNARDAMPQGGKLTIETANADLDEEYARQHLEVTPGPYVMLSVSDTGMGLDAEIKSRIFEPFFTTKEQGRGTGLGLSTVYGIVRQSGGHIWVYSEPGQGTTFKIYLPQVTEAGAAAEPVNRSPDSLAGSETILLVEDEELVRQVARRMLERNGYTVLEAGSGREALALSAQLPGPVHLVLTDVVMPGMSGRELAEELSMRHPGIKVIYMSGHTENAIIHHGMLDPGIDFIQKPFRHELLMRQVRRVLNAPFKPASVFRDASSGV